MGDRARRRNGTCCADCLLACSPLRRHTWTKWRQPVAALSRLLTMSRLCQVTELILDASINIIMSLIIRSNPLDIAWLRRWIQGRSQAYGMKVLVSVVRFNKHARMGTKGLRRAVNDRREILTTLSHEKWPIRRQLVLH
jgi:hypothetical protein